MGRWMSIIGNDNKLVSSLTQLPDNSHMEKYVEKYGEKFSKEFDTLVLELDLSEKISKKIINIFRKNKRKLFIYSANLRDEYTDKSIFEDVECLFFNERSASTFLDCNISEMEIHQIQKTFKEFIQNSSAKRGIITLYERGTVFYDNVLNQSNFIESSEGGNVNQIGEGEVLFSKVIADLLNGIDLKDAMNPRLVSEGTES